MTLEELNKAARKLADAVEFDMNGTIGKGGNGGLLSDTTLRAAHEVQALLNQPTPAAPLEPMGVLCTGCGSSWDNERLAEEKAKRPEILSCCPERHIVPVFNSAAAASRVLADEIDGLEVSYHVAECVGMADWATFEAGITKGLEAASSFIRGACKHNASGSTR